MGQSAAGWYVFSFMHIENTADAYNQGFIHRERHGADRILKYFIEKGERLNPEQSTESELWIDDWDSFRPDGGRWEEYGKTKGGKGSYFVQYRNPLILRVEGRSDPDEQTFDADISPDLKVEMAFRDYSSFLERLKKTGPGDYVNFGFNYRSVMGVPSELVELLKGYDWRSKHELQVRNWRIREEKRLLREHNDRTP
jgi:hypothetical protein